MRDHLLLITLRARLSESSETQTVLSATFLVLCTMVTLLPTPLIEPRYYIIPFLIIRLSISIGDGPTYHGTQSFQSTEADHRTKSANTRVEDVKIQRRVENKISKSNTRITDRRLWLEAFYYIATNFVTLYAFMYQPYYREEGLATGEEVGRFMW
jgi:hypothetical protein